ncbi:hypothetical protein L6386_04540, partial [bacterium]|nr:hypothetical protein [bacterium]
PFQDPVGAKCPSLRSGYLEGFSEVSRPSRDPADPFSGSREEKSRGKMQNEEVKNIRRQLQISQEKTLRLCLKFCAFALRTLKYPQDPEWAVARGVS